MGEATKNGETLEQRIERLEKARAEKREVRSNAQREQYADDLEALAELELEHDSIGTVLLPMYYEGLPTRLYVRTPKPIEYKRYSETVRKAHNKEDVEATAKAQEQLARVCWVYPADEDGKKKVLEKMPGALLKLAIVAAKLAEGKAEEEGKG